MKTRITFHPPAETPKPKKRAERRPLTDEERAELNGQVQYILRREKAGRAPKLSFYRSLTDREFREIAENDSHPRWAEVIDGLREVIKDRAWERAQLKAKTPRIPHPSTLPPRKP